MEQKGSLQPSQGPELQLCNSNLILFYILYTMTLFKTAFHGALCSYHVIWLKESTPVPIALDSMAQYPFHKLEQELFAFKI
jgi:hypothetical protein